MLLQRFKDKFILPNYKFDISAIPGQVLGAVKEGEEVSRMIQREYRGGIGNFLHLNKMV